MLRVRDLMTSDPLTVEPEETLRAAADLLTSAGVGGAPVTRGGQVVGVVSLTDILTYEADDPGVPTYRPQLVGPLEDDTRDAPELDDEPGQWFVQMWEDSGSDVTSRMTASEGPEWDALDEHTVAEVMSRKVLAVEPEATIKEAAQAMVRASVHRLLVLHNGEATGILTTLDVVRAVAEGMLVPGEEVARSGPR